MLKFLPDNIYTEKDVLYIDVRTPIEYEEDTIPGAINIPLFTNEQRAEIGTIYKQVSKRKAIELGYKYGGVKLHEYFTFVQNNEDKYHKIAFMCQRGGGRSGFVVVNLSLAFGNIYQLEGGYKGYRSYILENLEDQINSCNYLVLSGKTGVGKTRILTELSKQGYPVIDLEGFANNRGSLFGDIGLVANTRKKFDTLLFKSLRENPNKLIIVEGESKRIGKIHLPSALINKMDAGLHLHLKSTYDMRVKNILQDYGLNNGILKPMEKENIINKIIKLNQRLGKEAVSKLIEQIKEDQYQEVVGFLIKSYYDPLYQYTEDNYINKVDVHFDNLDSAIELIKERYKKLQIDFN